MQHTLQTSIRQSTALRRSFMKLARRTFDIAFDSWYKAGYWTDRYIPYVLADGGRVVANVSVNTMDIVWQKKTRHYIQLGTVMTDPAYRGQGLARRLLERALADWDDDNAAVYLFANDSVLEFYPKFGFVRCPQYQYALPVTAAPSSFHQLDMSRTKSVRLLQRCYQAGNPCAQLTWKNNFGLLMFYCLGPMKNSVYYSPQLDVVCIAAQDGDTLYCFDIFGPASLPLPELLPQLAGPATTTAVLGFTPDDTAGMTAAPITDGDTLFIRGGGEDLFTGQQRMFPILSHA